MKESIAIEERKFEVDLVKLSVEEFDVILGTDWLAKHGMLIDY